MNFLIVIPPYTINVLDEGIRPSKAMLPVGPLGVASLLIKLGHEVKVEDLVFANNWIDMLSERLLSSVDAVLLSCHTARNVSICRRAIETIRLRCPDMYVAIGGNVCIEIGTSQFHELGLDVDAVVRGFGHSETVVNALVMRRSGDIRGSVTSEFPVPSLGLLGVATHQAYLSASGGRYPIIGPGGFGCRWSCAYCSAKMESRHIDRKFDVVKSELDVAAGLGYRHIWCVDNLVNVDPDKTRTFDRWCLERGLRWSGMTRSELIVRNPEAIRGLRACAELAMGVENSSLQELNALRRGAGRDHFDLSKRAFQIVNAVGIQSSAFVMLGMPGVSDQGFWKLYTLLKDLSPTTVSWSFFNPSAEELLLGTKPDQFGFYHWPLINDNPERIVQQAMVLSGTWWSGWHLKSNPFFETSTEFGVRFEEATLYQERVDRSPTGDIWDAWKEVPTT